MKRKARCFALSLGLFCSAVMFGAESAPYVPAKATHAVSTWEGQWQDARRNRDVPVKIYYPQDLASRTPVIIFSHGLGGNKDGYRYLGEGWAARGYISVHLQHVGSDDAIWHGARPLQNARNAMTDPNNLRNRPLDVSFVVQMLRDLSGNTGFPMHGNIDLEHIGVAGHSFGAYTALAIGGRKVELGGKLVSFRDPSVIAVVAISSPSQDQPLSCKLYTEYRTPTMHITGTNDNLATKAENRRVPYDCTRRAEEYLTIFDGADHMTFATRDRMHSREFVDRVQGMVLDSTTAFWDAQLRGNASAKEWLAGGGFQRELGASGTWEKKSSE